MEEVTRVLSALDQGDPTAAEQLLTLVYDELRRLAAKKIANEKPGQTLQPTALVHEAYLRLVGGSNAETTWNNRNSFFSAAAEAMRRILIDRARHKGRVKHGGAVHRIDLATDDLAGPLSNERLLDVDEALTRLEKEHPDKAQIVKLRFFAGMTNAEAAAVAGVSPATAQRHWTFARVWLFSELEDNE
ncbi:MAG: sigma-70 family RNA polymerase sigma factor [Pirellulaceae bacterium]